MKATYLRRLILAAVPLLPVAVAPAKATPTQPANDPNNLIYSTYLGGSDSEWDEAIAVGPDGSAYIAGNTLSANFPVTPGAYDTSYNGGGDLFVARFDANRNLVFSTFLGGAGNEGGPNLIVDSQGNLYMTGHTTSTDFPTTPGAYDRTYNGGQSDAYVVKLSADGSSLLYSTYVGGSGQDCSERCGIAIDATGAAYITAETDSADFPTTPGVFDTTFNGGQYDAYVAKLDPSGSTLVYGTYVGGSADDEGRSVTVDASGNLYLAGWTTSSGFPTTPGAFDTSFNGGSGFCGDGFAVKLNPSGSALVYSTFLGGSSEDCAWDLALDSTGAVYVGGETFSADFPTTPGAYDPTANGSDDAFVAKLDASGSSLLWSTYVGGTGEECPGSGCTLALDPFDRVYLEGVTKSSNFPTTPDAYDTSFNGAQDIFLSLLSADGAELVYSTFLGGSSYEHVSSVAVDSYGLAHLAGRAESSNFPTTPNALDRRLGGSGDAFYTVINPGLDLPGLHVAGVHALTDGTQVGAQALIHDQNGLPGAGARVTFTVAPPQGGTHRVTVQANDNGLARVSLLVQGSGTYTFCVVYITRPGSYYDAASNGQTCASVMVP